MSAVVKLGSKMPGDFETNGLDALAEELVSDPKTLRVGIVVFDTDKVTVNTDTGESVPTIRVRRFEPVGTSDDVSQAIRDVFQETVEARTGRTPLPMDVAEVIDQDRLDDGTGPDEY